MKGIAISIITSVLATLVTIAILMPHLKVPVETIHTTKYYGIPMPFEEASCDIDMKGYMLLNMSMMHICSFSMEGGKTNVSIQFMQAGDLPQDFHISRLVYAVNAAPGAGKTTNASVTDGTTTMSVTLSGSQTHGYTTTNAFDVDVSAKSLTLQYSQDAGGSVNRWNNCMHLLLHTCSTLIINFNHPKKFRLCEAEHVLPQVSCIRDVPLALLRM